MIDEECQPNQTLLRKKTSPETELDLLTFSVASSLFTRKLQQYILG